LPCPKGTHLEISFGTSVEHKLSRCRFTCFIRNTLSLQPCSFFGTSEDTLGGHLTLQNRSKKRSKNGTHFGCSLGASWFTFGSFWVPPPLTPTRRRPDADLACNPWPCSPVKCFEQNPSVARALLVFRIWWFRRLGISFAYNFDLSKDCRSDPRGPMLAFQRKGRGPIYPLRDAGRGPFTDCSLLPRSPQDKYQHVRSQDISIRRYVGGFGCPWARPRRPDISICIYVSGLDPPNPKNEQGSSHSHFGSPRLCRRPLTPT